MSDNSNWKTSCSLGSDLVIDNAESNQVFAAADEETARVLVPWVCDVLLSDRSIEAYGTDLTQYAKFLRKFGRTMLGASVDDVRVYKASLMRSGSRPSTVARKLSVLRGAYREFANKGLVSWNVANGIAAIRSPVVTKNTTPALSPDQVRLILRAVPTNTLQGVRDRALLETFFITGARVTALCRAHVGDLEFDGTEYFLSLREKRGKETRKVLLDAADSVTAYLFAAGISKNKTSPLFRPLSPNGRHLLRRNLHRSTPWRLVKKYCRRAGIDPQRFHGRGICVHSLRKTAITNAIRNGATIHEAREFADHEDIRTTDLYFERRAEDAHRAARCIQLF